jgi:polyisoprenyl-teichoic acid--peptidoglycan teichoic acid transferase
MKKTFLFIAIILAFGAALIGFTISIGARIALLDVFFSLTPSAPIIAESNILVLGVDDAFGHRSDTIMVLHIDPAKRSASVVSVPRDTIVNIPGRGLDKVNHAYAYGGADLSRQTLEDFFRVSIPYYVVVDLTGIEKLIDEIGGVMINVEKRMYYVDYAGDLHIDLQPGLQKLDGKQAMGYLRFRHTDNDFARIGRQQNFLKSVADQAMRKENLLRSPQIFLSLLQCVQTNLNSREILGLSLALRGANETGRVNMAMVPGFDFMVDKIYYWRPDETAVRRLATTYLYNGNLASAEQESKN